MHIHLAPFAFCCDAPPTPPPASEFRTGVIKPYTPSCSPPAPQSLHVTLSAKDAKFIIGEDGRFGTSPEAGRPGLS